MTLFVCNPDFLREYLSKVNAFTDESITPYIDFITGSKTAIDDSSNPILSKPGESIAVIKIEGILRNEPSFMSRFFGYRYTTYSMIIDAVDQVKNDSDIKKVILEIDSPGGYVSPGLDQAWLAIKDLRTIKEVIAINKGMVASGAYWIASAANEIHSINALTQQGSIGVYQAFIDWTENDKQYGIKEIRIVSSHAPLKNLSTDDPRLVEQIQGELDYIEGIFLKRIAEGRSVSVEEVIENFGQGGLVNTDTAVKVHMLDRVIQENVQTTSDNNVEVQDNTNNKTKDNHMSLGELMTSDPSINAEVEKIKKVAYDEGVQAAKKEYNERIAFAMNYLANSSYNEHIHELARGVITGEAKPDTLKEVVKFFDKKEVKATIEQATEQSAAINTTTTEEPNVTEETFETDGKIRSQGDIKKAREAKYA